MVKTLVVVLHPHPEKSVRGKILLSKISGQKDVTVRIVKDHMKGHELTEAEVKEEQKVILAHDKIIFFYPVYWFALPAFGKQYLDQVFTMGFAYVYAQSTHAQLKGKHFAVIVTTGGTEALYQNNLLFQLPEAISGYTGMVWDPPFIFGADSDAKAGEVLKHLK